LFQGYVVQRKFHKEGVPLWTDHIIYWISNLKPNKRNRTVFTNTG